MQHHFSGRTNIDLASIIRKDSENSQNTSSDEDNVSESEEDIVLKGNPLSTDSSSSMKKINEEENEYTTEHLFAVTCLGRRNLLWKTSFFLQCNI